MDLLRALIKLLLSGERKPRSDKMEIQCVQKNDRNNPYERIPSIGGVDPDRKPWKMPEVFAIDGMKMASIDLRSTGAAGRSR
jgi:hypothetical protein